MLQRKELQIKFLQTVNRIPTLEQNFNQVPESDISAMLSLVEHDMNGAKPVSYLKKVWSLSCTYGHVTLYVLYHLIDMQSKGQSIDQTLLYHYKNCMHHMLQVLYLADSFTYREMWYVAITLDAVIRNKHSLGNIKFTGMTASLIGPLTHRCMTDQLSSKIDLLAQFAGKFDFVSYNRQLGTQLMLSEGHPIFMADLYRGDDQFEIYQLIWDNNRDYTNFAPPDSWFPSYDHKHLRTIYEKVALIWKSDFYSIQRYTDSVRNLVLMVTYYALLLHCHYLQMTWYIVFERVKSFSPPSKQKEMETDITALLRIPLFLVETIMQNLHFSEETEYLNDIKYNLTYHENADRKAFNQFIDRLLHRYNFYAEHFEAKLNDYSVIKVKFLVPNQMDLYLLKTTLLEFTKILDSYYETVKRTLSPTSFHVIEYFTATKPVFVNLKTPQDPNPSLTKPTTVISKISCTTNITVIEHEQDWETHMHFLRILNRIPTLDKNPKEMKISELDAMTKGAKKEDLMISLIPPSYRRKVKVLNCSYGYVFLNMLYHINDLYRNERMDEEKHFYLLRYIKCAHRFVSVMYASKSLIYRELWIAVITLDAIRHGKMGMNDFRFDKLVLNIIVAIKKCYNENLITNLIPTYNELVEKGSYDLATYNDQLLAKLMLSDGSEDFMMNLYYSEERFDIFKFFWDADGNYTNLAPPVSWFPLYDDKHLRTVNEDVAFNWERCFYIIIRYKEAVINLVMMVTYYALLLHFHYLESTRSSITEPVKSDDFKAWGRIPLPLVKVIYRDLNILEDNSCLVGEIENYLAVSDNTDRTSFNAFINRLLVRYNFYTTQLDLKQMDYSMMTKKFSVPGHMESAVLISKLLEIVQILNAYYETVKRTFLPTTFRAIEYFAYSKPDGINFEKSQDPNQLHSTITYNYDKRKTKRQLFKQTESSIFHESKD
ncbi:uncharacterized protein LOC126836918 [Adelges cooleyi]|uniref:uncharacterized protein LOC126836918 n=1 Tax=Adelges cooleyi TaxID=133065 RepID=UPI00217FCE7C|nr:uncharacterized protein LOC126836918 [Adelges cooleyi]